MGYCNTTNVENLLAQSLTTATNPTPASGTPGNLLNIGKTLDKNLITTTIIDQWILWAGNQIDAILGSMYNVPFCQIADFETVLYSDISEYNPYVILDSGCSLTAGDEIVLIEGGEEEKHVIKEALGNGVFETVDEILFPFSSGSRCLRVKYPDPITLIATRLAVSQIYEKYFAAQTNPNESDYGKIQRKMAVNSMNDVLNGRTVLHGAHRIGHRFKNSNIVSRYHLPGSSGAMDNINIEDVS